MFLFVSFSLHHLPYLFIIPISLLKVEVSVMLYSSWARLMVLIFLLGIKPVTGIVTTLNVKMFVGRFAAINVGKVVFRQHHMRWIEWTVDCRNLLVSLVVVQLWVFVELVSELGEHYGGKAGGSVPIDIVGRRSIDETDSILMLW